MATPDQTSDYLLDRRKLRRKLSFWRIAAFAFLIVAAGAATWRLTGSSGGSPLQHHIARITINGVDIRRIRVPWLRAHLALVALARKHAHPHALIL
jgi:anti-sigma-K factor RskA